MNEEKKPKPRGFAAMTAERRKEIASKGGMSSSAKGVAHRFTSAEASAAGKRPRKKKLAVTQ